MTTSTPKPKSFSRNALATAALRVALCAGSFSLWYHLPTGVNVICLDSGNRLEIVSSTPNSESPNRKEAAASLGPDEPNDTRTRPGDTSDGRCYLPPVRRPLRYCSCCHPQCCVHAQDQHRRYGPDRSLDRIYIWHGEDQLFAFICFSRSPALQLL
ncbi:uncharacterized protein B0T15DRAFT_526531 [Chaetomium strumarium]|uniref:Uncharacterized protein n=1 Tax=Chaetomium strumarium TaxID=1170767 RepID=A0AAJ0H0I6_9PEZI|nr:hypothetical protein B0T15DRAFT_526531 [Chaetomium strumarium]